MLKLGMKGTKWDIFIKSVYMFSEGNYHGISMRNIADSVGIKPASIYNHFSSKDELLATIYEFYNINLISCIPDIEMLKKLSETLPVKELMMKADIRFPKDLQPLMDRILIIATSNLRTDPRAEELLSKNLVDIPYTFFGGLITFLIESGRIEPVDVDALLSLYINFAYGAAIRNYTDHRINEETWLNGLSLLVSLIKPKK